MVVHKYLKKTSCGRVVANGMDIGPKFLKPFFRILHQIHIIQLLLEIQGLFISYIYFSKEKVQISVY